MFYINEVVYVKILSKNTDGINFLSGLRDQNFGKMGLRDQNNGKKIGINGSRIYHVTTLNECHYFYPKQAKKCRWRTNVKKTNIFIAKAIASDTIVSSTNQEGHYKQGS